MYEEDAIIGHREFDLKLTQRVKMSMVGVPEMSFNFWAAYVLLRSINFSPSLLTFTVGNSWEKVRVKANIYATCAYRSLKGYKVGRVDQAETALGAEMRLAADKGKGKKTPGKNGGDKIVKRYVVVNSVAQNHRQAI